MKLVREAWRAIGAPNGLDARRERLAAAGVGLLVLTGAVVIHLGLTLVAPADARFPDAVVTPSTTSRQ